MCNYIQEPFRNAVSYIMLQLVNNCIYSYMCIQNFGHLNLSLAFKLSAKPTAMVLTKINIYSFISCLCLLPHFKLDRYWVGIVFNSMNNHIYHNSVFTDPFTNSDLV